MKRTVQVNLKMTQDDFELQKKAPAKRWADAEITNSGIVLGLASAVREVLGRARLKELGGRRCGHIFQNCG